MTWARDPVWQAFWAGASWSWDASATLQTGATGAFLQRETYQIRGRMTATTTAVHRHPLSGWAISHDQAACGRRSKEVPLLLESVYIRICSAKILFESFCSCFGQSCCPKSQYIPIWTLILWKLWARPVPFCNFARLMEDFESKLKEQDIQQIWTMQSLSHS